MKRVCNKRRVAHVHMYVRRKVQETSFARVYLCTWTRYARVSIAIAMSASVLVTLDLKLHSHVRIFNDVVGNMRVAAYFYAQREISRLRILGSYFRTRTKVELYFYFRSH